MGKAMYLGVSSKARKVKKAYLGVSSKARKIKKMYIGASGKARLFWSGSDGGFVINTYISSKYGVAKSTDGTSNWTVGSGGSNFNVGMVYALGKYWGARATSGSLSISYSDDGLTWTTAATLSGSVTSTTNRQYDFSDNGTFTYVNGMFYYCLSNPVSPSSYNYTRYIWYSEDGITWNYKGVSIQGTTYAKQLIYGTVDGVTSNYLLVYSGSTLTLYKFDDIKTASTVTMVAGLANSVYSSMQLYYPMVIRNNGVYVIYRTSVTDTYKPRSAIIKYRGGNTYSYTFNTSDTYGIVKDGWSTDKYFIFEVGRSNSGGTTYKAYRYDYSKDTAASITPDTCLEDITSLSWNTTLHNENHPTLSVGSKLYKYAYDKLAYSLDYGSTFTIDSYSGLTDSIASPDRAVYGDESSGRYAEMY